MKNVKPGVFDIGKIRIDGLDYEIIKAQDGEGRAFAASYYGQAFYAKLELKISEHTPSFNLQTLLHEILHVVDYNSFLGDGIGELKINRISVSLLQVLLDNPQLCELISFTAKERIA